MKRSWTVLRTDHTHPDSTRRWDRVYQLLLEWAAAAAHPQPAPQEAADAHRDLRPGLDPTPGPDPDHRPAT